MRNKNFPNKRKVLQHEKILLTEENYPNKIKFSYQDKIFTAGKKSRNNSNKENHLSFFHNKSLQTFLNILKLVLIN